MLCLKQKILCAAAIALCSVVSAQAEDKVMRVGAEPAYAPFEFIDEQTKELTGFDIELIKAIADIEGYKIEINTMPFDALIPALLTNNVDAVLSAITITEERQKRVDFSVPYYQSGLTILINDKDKDNIKSVKDLEGKSICVQIGTTGATYASTQIPGATVSQFNTAPESYLELKAGGCVAAINDRPVNDYYLATGKSEGTISVPGILSSENYGIAVRKGDKEMLEAINSGYKKLQDNGDLDKIYNKWFGSSK